jgi:hypothetical protein
VQASGGSHTGECRVLYAVRDRVLLILVVAVGHRREIRPYISAGR